MTSFIDKIKSLEPTLFEDESYGFLQHYQDAKKWYVYDSKKIDFFVTKALVDTFCSFHGKIPFATAITQHFDQDELYSRYWSIVPLGVFRYKACSLSDHMLLNSYQKKEGWIIEGAYWDNGFFYIIKDDLSIIQLKFFIDEETKINHAYPDAQ